MKETLGPHLLVLKESFEGSDPFFLSMSWKPSKTTPFWKRSTFPCDRPQTAGMARHNL